MYFISTGYDSHGPKKIGDSQPSLKKGLGASSPHLIETSVNSPS